MSIRSAAEVAACRTDGRGRLAGRAQVILLLAPAVLLLTFVLWQRSRARTRPVDQGAPTAPEDNVQTGPVQGWEKRLSLGDAGDIDLRLERLHPHDSRQSFDAVALAARLGRRSDGAEPWRLLLSALSPESVPDGDVGDVLIGDLQGVRVEGLEPLVHADERPVRGRVSDPMRTLFAFPEAELRAGQAVDLVFWGLAPEGRVGVTLPGVDAHGVEPRAELLPLARAGSRASQSIATLDARRGSEGEER